LLYNRSLGICFFLYKNLSTWSKRYTLVVQYIPWHKICHMLHLYENLLDHILSQMSVHTTQKISTTVNM
jgi:hypothetical protein